jgi:hypothetical protein
MKQSLVLISLLILATLAMPEDNYNRRNTQDPSVGMSYQSARLGDFESSGMTEEEYTDAISNQVITEFIGQMLEQVKQTHIDRYELEDGGALTNVDITVTPPSANNILYKADSKDSSMLVQAHGIGIKATADVDMYYGTILGEATVDIKGIDLNLVALPQLVNGVPTTNIKYHMNLKDADFTFDINILEDKHDMPEDMQEGFIPLAALMGGGSSMKIAAKQMLQKTFKQNAKDVVKMYFDSMDTSYKISRKTDHNVSFNSNKI